MTNDIYCTSFCNQGHRIRDGVPIDHECYVLPPAALAAERSGDVAKALDILDEQRPRRRAHPGRKSWKRAGWL